MKRRQYKILKKLSNAKIPTRPNQTLEDLVMINAEMNKLGVSSYPINIEENFKGSIEDIRFLSSIGYIKECFFNKKNAIALTEEGIGFLINEENKDWLTKTTEWFKPRNIIKDIINFGISIAALIVAIISLVKSCSK